MSDAPDPPPEEPLTPLERVGLVLALVFLLAWGGVQFAAELVGAYR